MTSMPAAGQAKPDQAALDRRRAYVEALAEAAEQAAEALGGWSLHEFSIAGLKLRLRVAGDELAEDMTRALAHRAAAAAEIGGQPAMTIDIWDTETSGCPVPPPPWSLDDYREHGAIRGHFDERMQAMYRWDLNALSLLDHEDPGGPHGYMWLADATTLPDHERAAPLRPALQQWLARSGRHLIHAAAVGDPGGCIMLAGRGGSGKSTTAYGCIGRLMHLSDDFCVLDPDEARVHSLYSTVKADERTIGRLGIAGAKVANPVRAPDQKAVIFLAEQAPELVLDQSPLRGIVVPRVAGGPHSELRPTTAGPVLGALAPSSMLLFPGTGQAAMSRMVAVVRAVPGYELALGEDPTEVTETIARLAEELS